MVKVFVAQTHDNDRKMVADFVTAAGHDVKSYTTDIPALTRLTWDIMPLTKPAVIISSQRDVLGQAYISNMLHTVALNLAVPTLTVVYSRAAAHLGAMPGAIHFIADLISTEKHRVKILPKNDEPDKEMEYLAAYIDAFAPPIK